MHDQELILTVVKPHVSDSRETEIAGRGAALKSGSATTLTNSDIHAHNPVVQRQVIVPETKTLAIKGPTLNFIFPSASVTKMTLTLS